MKYVVIELETIVDTSLPPMPTRRDSAATAPPLPYHQIVALGAALIDPNHVVRHISASATDERSLLRRLVDIVAADKQLTIVAWKTRTFDVPVIAARCLRHGLPFRWFSLRHHRQIDVSESFIDRGGLKPYSRDVAATLIGIPSACGSDASTAASDAERAELAATRCLHALAQTTALFLRGQLLRGLIDPVVYTRAVRDLLGLAAPDPRIATMFSALEMERLLPHGSDVIALAMDGAS